MPNPISRRDLLGAAGLAIVVTGCGSNDSSTQAASGPASEPLGLVRSAGAQSLPIPSLAQSASPSLLFVQTAVAGGSIQAVPGQANTFVLILKQVGPTIVFADRPQRFFRTKSTAEFVANDFPAFGNVFPNAVLEIRSGGVTLSTIVTLLSAATKVGDPSEVTYLVRTVPPQSPSDYQGGVVQPSFLPATFEFATIFIDDLREDTSTNYLALVTPNQLRLTANFTVRMTAGQSQAISIQSFVDFNIDVQLAVANDSPIVLEADPFPLRVPVKSTGVVTLQARAASPGQGPRDLSTQVRILAFNSANASSFDQAIINLQLHVPG